MMVQDQELPLTRSRGADARVADVTRETLDALGDLAIEYIALAKIEVRDELEATIKRSLWYAAAWALSGVAGALLVIAVFLVSEGLIESPGVRLLILAALLGIAAFALVLQADTVRRRGAEGEGNGGR